MKTRIIITSMMGAALTLSSAASAQEKITVNGNIDLVNNYVWRGMDQNSGFSVQPTLGLSYKGLSLSAWGSQSLTNNADRDVQELDLNLSYSIGGLSATLTTIGGEDCTVLMATTNKVRQTIPLMAVITSRRHWLIASATSCLSHSAGQHGSPELMCVQTATSVATQLTSTRHTTLHVLEM